MYPESVEPKGFVLILPFPAVTLVEKMGLVLTRTNKKMRKPDRFNTFSDFFCFVLFLLFPFSLCFYVILFRLG